MKVPRRNGAVGDRLRVIGESEGVIRAEGASTAISILCSNGREGEGRQRRFRDRNRDDADPTHRQPEGLLRARALTLLRARGATE